MNRVNTALFAMMQTLVGNIIDDRFFVRGVRYANAFGRRERSHVRAGKAERRLTAASPLEPPIVSSVRNIRFQPETVRRR